MSIRHDVPFVVLLVSLTACSAPPVKGPPAHPAMTSSTAGASASAARTEPVVDEYFGVTVADPYRWMEKPDNAELTAWMESEGARARRSLDAIAGHDALLARVRETGLGVAQVVRLHRRGDTLFYLKVDKGADLRKLVVRGKDGTERVLIDPNTVPSTNGGHASIDHFEPSPDGKLVAYGLARDGGEITVEHVLDVATGRDLPDAIEPIWGEFPVSWRPDGKGFFYTRMASEGFADPHVDRLQKMRAFLHQLGTPTSHDVPVLGYGVSTTFPYAPQEFPRVIVTPGSPWVLALGTGARQEARVAIARLADVTGPSTAWTVIGDYSDGIASVALHGDDVFILSNKGASNGRVLRFSAKGGRLDAATTFVAESDAVVEDIDAAADGLYVRLQKDGRSILRRVGYAGGEPAAVALPLDGWIDELVADPQRPGLDLEMEGWTQEDAFFSFDPKTRAFAELDLKPKGDADYSGIVAEELTAPAADGVEIPLTVLRRRDLALDGARPTILFGYGAYGSSMTPAFRPYLLAWLERGGIWAVAHVRGGGEKGDAWRKGGARATKPNSWRDFNACAEWLIKKGYTSSAKLAAYSASAGGILVGRAITERPDLYAAAGIYAGEVNVLRYLQSSNGANQSAELGTPDTDAGFRSLLAMDAFQSVKPGVPYPAVLLATGLNDARVSPWQSAKLAARLQASTSSGRPVLLRVQRDEGHGVGSTRQQRLALWADVWSFFLQQMGSATQP